MINFESLEAKHKEATRPRRDQVDIDTELKRMEQRDEFFTKTANPLYDEETDTFHNATQLVHWLNETDRTFESCLRISEIASQFHPLFKMLMERGRLQQPPLSWQRWELPQHVRITNCCQYGGKVWMFVAAFNEHCKKNIIRIDDPKKLSTGFYVKDEEVAYMVRLSDLHPIWRPKTEKEFLLETRQAWTRTAIGENRNWDDNVMKLYRTTATHEWGPGWAGQLRHNLPELSTVAGGARSAMPLPRKRYKIQWVDLKTLITRRTIEYDASELSKLLEESRIEYTDGHEITPTRFRACLDGVGGSTREEQEWQSMYPRRKSNSD